MRLTSTAFDDGGIIPVRYTCDGEGISPPLRIERVPDGAETLAVVVEDPDAPGGTFVHWVVFDLEVRSEIPEAVDGRGTPGVNSRDRIGYTPPCPPGGSHRYVFDVHALDTVLGLEAGVSVGELRQAMDGHVLGSGRLVGRYER